jgi:hypothetical protein
MAMHADAARPVRFSDRKSDAIEYRVIFAVAFDFFLLAAAAHQLIPVCWRPNLDPTGRSRSIIAEARVAAANSVTFAFM